MVRDHCRANYHHVLLQHYNLQVIPIVLLMKRYKQLVANVVRQFFNFGMTVTQEDITRDCIRLTLPYADTLIKIDIIYESDNHTKGHELSLSALGVTSRNTALRIMTNVCHDITKASLFDGVLALYNAVREDQMLLAEQTTNKVVGGAAFQSRLPGTEYLVAEDHSSVHCKVPLSNISNNDGPPCVANGTRLAVSFRCRFEQGHASKNPNIFLSTDSGNIPVPLPKWNTLTMNIDSYVDQVTVLVRNQWKSRQAFYQCLDVHFHYPLNWSTITQDFRSFLLEYVPTAPPLHKDTAKKSKKKLKTRLCIVSVRIEKSFPEFAPSVSLHQIYPAEMGNSSGISDCEVILPHSPRWTPEEIAKRLHKECSIAMCQGM